MKQLISLCLLIILILGPGKAYAEPKEPALQYLIKWGSHKSLGAVLSFFVNDYGVVEFAHPVISMEPATECNIARRVANEIHLTTISDQAFRYLVSSEPVMYRIVGFDDEPFIVHGWKVVSGLKISNE